MRKTGNIEAIYPLSPMQEGILFHALYTPGTMGYLEQFSYTLEGNLNVPAFEQAWQMVVARHPILRTLFTWEKRNQPLQIVRQKVTVPFAFEDWQSHSPSEQQSQLEAFLISDRELGFNLSKAPLMRLHLIRLNKRRYQFTWCFHHLLLDGWSGQIVLSEFFNLYESICKSKAPKLPVRRPYREYIAWLQKQDLTQTERFWRTYLNGFTKSTPFGIDRSEIKGQMEAYTSQKFVLPEDQTKRLKLFAQEQHLTMSTIIEGIWAIILSRYSNEHDVVFGTTVSGRTVPLENIENMVGVFINTLPLRVRVKPAESLSEWLKSLQARQAEMQIYEHCPLTHIQQCSDLPAKLPLFESILAISNYPIPQKTETEQSSLRLHSVRNFEQTNYPLTIQVSLATSLSWRFRYDRHRFDDETIGRMTKHIQTLCESIVADPYQSIGELSWLTETERQQLLFDWNDTGVDYPKDKCIHELFEEQVKHNPENVALISDQGQMSYGELNKKANQLARYLRKLGVGPNVMVGISMERTLDMVVAIIGILKAGGAYLPIDASYPKERIAYMLEDSAAPVLLTRRILAEKLPRGEARIVYLDSQWKKIKLESDKNLVCENTPGDLAYINYTSGSTGRPKGVKIPHLGVTRLIVGNNYANLDADNNILHLSTISFDASTLELWGALLHGAKCVLCPEDLPTPSQLADIIKRFKINFLWLTASYFNLIIDEKADVLKGVKQLLTGGEALSVKHVKKALTVLNETQLINGYGPTENTTFTCCYPIPKDLDSQLKSIPIGRPIKNTRVYILNQQMQPVPLGVTGELYIGGDGLAHGYLNQSDLTKEKFIPDPFCEEAGARVYKTGDLVRYLPDGNIEFIGRIDHQVKIRGFRIELGEIEAILESHPAVLESVVDIRVGEDQTKHLIAYVVAKLNTNEFITGLRIFLQAKLPDYMIPTIIIVLDKMPLTATGKINRQALPEPDREAIKIEKRYVAPRNTLEEKLSAIWAKHLGLNKVGVKDNFFELGGHSLLAVRLIADIKKEIGKEVYLPELFKRQTIEQLSLSLEQNIITKKHGPLVPINSKGHKIPIFLVHCSDKLHYYIDDDQPLFLFLSFWGDDQRPLEYKSVEEIAADYIKALKDIFQQGPYVLCGFSIGGLIAIEMAKQLSNNNSNADVPLLFLIDPTIPAKCISKDNNSVKNSSKKWKHRIRLLTNDLPRNPLQTTSILFANFNRKLKKNYNHGLYRLGIKYGWKIPKSAREFGASKLYTKAASIYNTDTYSGVVEIVQLERAYKISNWKRIFNGKLVHHRIKETGKHIDMVHDLDVVKIWAEHLKKALEKYN